MMRTSNIGKWATRPQLWMYRRARTFATAAPRVAMSPLEPHNTLDYVSQLQRLEESKKSSTRPLTLTEKILYSHLDIPEPISEIERGRTILQLRPDRVACHDATATMALLQFISAGLDRVATPTTVHSDHLIVAKEGAEQDIRQALSDHQEVYNFLSSATRKYGIGYWKAGSGIIHINIFENYAVPGKLLIGTDSHTPNCGGLGMLGVGVGGSDAVDAMAGMPWELMCPKVVGVRLNGDIRNSKWASSKDIICKIAGILSVSGGKGKVIEFFGPGVNSLGSTAMSTVCNMSAEIGSTSCIFPYTNAMGRYLSSTKREDIARLASQFSAPLLTADPGSQDFYDELIEIDLDTLEPHINGPFTPDLSHPLSKFKDAVTQSDWPVDISASMVGSCTNSSYEDLLKVCNLVRQAKAVGVSKIPTPFLLSPGSEQIRATAEAEGILQELREAGATILSSSCGPCVGQWDRSDVKMGEKNSVISSYNRNFAGRHDSNPQTHSFVTSPEMATVFAYAGKLSFNPVTDSIPISMDKSASSSEGAMEGLRFEPPLSNELPEVFFPGENRFQAPVSGAESKSAQVNVDPQSDRLQLLTPFQSWQKDNARDMSILIKVQGKCTTDHISPAGPWYKYRGHLENISNNMLLGATNAFLGTDARQRGRAINPISGYVDTVPATANELKQVGVKWCIIGDDNYGEGSSREHAALEPRFLGGTAVIAKSFARIHETNLKKQGMLPLTFDNPADYNKISEGDKVTLVGVEAGEMQPGKQIMMQVTKMNGETWTCALNHSHHAKQIEWLRAGSALNYIKQVSLKLKSSII